MTLPKNCGSTCEDWSKKRSPIPCSWPDCERQKRENADLEYNSWLKPRYKLTAIKLMTIRAPEMARFKALFYGEEGKLFDGFYQSLAALGMEPKAPFDPVVRLVNSDYVDPGA